MNEVIQHIVQKADPMSIPYFAIACLVVYLSYKVICKFGGSFITAHQKLADNIEALKDTLELWIKTEKQSKDQVINKLEDIESKLRDIYEHGRCLRNKEKQDNCNL